MKKNKKIKYEEYEKKYFEIERYEIDIEKCSIWCWMRYITNQEKYICTECIELVKKVKKLKREVRKMYLELNND